MIAALTLGVLISSTTGLLNSCRTWSNWYSGSATKWATILAENDFERNTSSIYPAICVACLVLHLVWYSAVRWLGRRVAVWSIHKQNLMRTMPAATLEVEGGNTLQLPVSTPG
jgi:hypothetical protein